MGRTGETGLETGEMHIRFVRQTEQPVKQTARKPFLTLTGAESVRGPPQTQVGEIRGNSYSLPSTGSRPGCVFTLSPPITRNISNQTDLTTQPLSSCVYSVYTGLRGRFHSKARLLTGRSPRAHSGFLTGGQGLLSTL